jgi:hypothetical protein
MKVDREHQETLTKTFRGARRMLLVSLVIAVVSAFVFPPNAVVIVVSVALGVAIAALILVSLRFYNFWLSWVIWAVPSAVLLGTVASAASGADIDVWQLLWQGFYTIAASATGTLCIVRARFLAWMHAL